MCVCLVPVCPGVSMLCSRSCYFRTTISEESTPAIVCCGEFIVSFSAYICYMSVHVQLSPLDYVSTLYAKYFYKLNGIIQS